MSEFERIVGKMKQIDKYNTGKPAFRHLCPLCGKKARGRFVRGGNQFPTKLKGVGLALYIAALGKK